jgi:hypothetical protein
MVAQKLRIGRVNVLVSLLESFEAFSDLLMFVVHALYSDMAENK